MGYLEFLHGSRIIYLALNIPEKLHMTTSLRKARRTRDVCVNTIQYPHTLKSNIHHSNKRKPPPFFHSDTNPVLGHVLVHSVDKTHVLVVTVELVWLLCLDTLSFNFVPIANKSFRFIRFRRSYVNHPADVLTNYCQSYTAFLLDLGSSK